MDPDEALKNARAASTRIREILDNAEEDENGDQVQLDEEASELQEAFDALDGWLSAGGFPPAEWSKSVDVTRTRSAIVEAVRTWVNADCGATEADSLIAALAALDDAAYTADVDKKKALALVDDAAKKIT